VDDLTTLFGMGFEYVEKENSLRNCWNISSLDENFIEKGYEDQ
jgi:hypothetical protein